VKLKFPLIVFTILLSVVGLAAQPQSDRETGKQFVGTYVYYFTFGGSSIRLNSDGTFREDASSCTFTTQQTGTYSYSDGVLRFTVTKYTGKQNGDGKELDLFDAKTRREFYGYPADEKDDTVNPHFVLYPVTWGQRTYLIYEQDLDDFTDAINFGVEPRVESPERDYYGSFLMREGDEEKKAEGEPSLPQKYKDRLTREPIEAMIVSVDGRGEEQVATIDKGRLAGVKVGMKFIGKEQKPEPWSKEGIVLTVDDTSATLHLSGRTVGEVLTTRPVLKDRFQ
jgi:hypothetical protein